MKKLLVIAALAVLMASAPVAASGIGFGLAYMDSSDSDADNGMGVKVSLDLGTNWNFDVRASFFDGHGFISGPREVVIEATPVDIGLSYDFETRSRVKPYVGAGINYGFFKAESYNFVIDQVEQARIKDEPGYYGVVGAEAVLKNRTSIFFEALYRQNKPTVQGDGLAAFSGIPVDFAGAGATVGLVYTW